MKQDLVRVEYYSREYQDKVLECDFGSSRLTQSGLDWAMARALEGYHHQGKLYLNLRNIQIFPQMPRLIVDYGEIYETLVKLLKESKQ